MSNLSANAQLLGNLEHTTAELLEGMTEERGRGFASDNESWAALKGYLERAEKMRKDMPYPTGTPRASLRSLTAQPTSRRGTTRRSPSASSALMKRLPLSRRTMRRRTCWARCAMRA